MSCGLTSCVLKGDEEDLKFAADWTEAERRLDAMRRSSVDYIRSIVGRAEQNEKE